MITTDPPVPAGSPGGRPAGHASGDRVHRILVADLERRLRILDAADDREFGPFTLIDWALCLLLFVALPLALAVWCA
jgi:hypothetical protein